MALFPSKDNQPTVDETPIQELKCVAEPRAKPDLSFEAVAAAAPVIVRSTTDTVVEDEQQVKDPSKAKWLKYSMAGTGVGLGDYD